MPMELRREKGKEELEDGRSYLIPNSPNGMGGGQFTAATQNFKKKKCQCSHNDNTALIKQISRFA